MSWCTELPLELTSKPLGLITLSGLDIQNNPIHKTIWESFAINRQPQRVPLSFQHVELSHQYPKARPKRTSYDWYVPKGILKTNWLLKHLQSVPAVAVVFYDLDWDDPQWTERCTDLAGKVDQVRTSLQGRATKIGLVLIQKNAGLPGDQDLDQQQKAQMLCNRCGSIPAKSLFVLPYTEHLPGYVMRLENAFYEMAQNYYYAESRRVKSYRELLNKTTHQLLFVRHQFKAAFFNELKQDPTSAIRHYKQAYEHIKELRMYDSHMLEIKVVAGFVNYKICKIAFQQATPRDAISQFRQHVDLFKNKVGIKELSFENSAWMAKQFCIFGELFSEAISMGLTALITQHPGFYFQQSANHTIQRRKQCLELCSSEEPAPPSSDPLEALGKLTHYGQRPWRQGHQSIDPPEPAREREGIQALQKRERDVQHSWIIIPLLSSAVSQFKRYKSPRMKRYLIVQMGEEYYLAKEYTKALELVSHVMWEYRAERWSTLLNSILKITLRSAFLVGNVSSFVSTSMEMIASHIPDRLLSMEEKSKIQSNLMRVLFLAAGSGCPEDPDILDQDEAERQEVESRWIPSPGNSEANTFTIDMSSLASFVQVKAKFTSSTVSADSMVSVDVCLLISSPSPVTFSKLCVLFSNPIYNELCSLEDDEGDTLLLEPHVVKAFRFSFVPQMEDVGQSLQITNVTLRLGNPTKRGALLSWNHGGGDVMTQPTTPATTSFWEQPPPTKHKLAAEAEWQYIPHSPTSVQVTPRSPRLQVEVVHSAPCLVNEFYVVKVTVRNEETITATGVSLDVGLKEASHDVQALENTTHIDVVAPVFESASIVSKRTDVVLPDLEPGQSIEKHVFIKTLQPGQRSFELQVDYSVCVDVEIPDLPGPLHESSNITPVVTGADTLESVMLACQCQTRAKWSLASVRPFQILTKPMTMKFEPTEVVYTEEPFLLSCDIKSISDWPVEIKTSHLTISEFLTLPPGESTMSSMLEDLKMMPHDVSRDLYCLYPMDTPTTAASIGMQLQQQGIGAGVNLPLGKFTLEWRRSAMETDETSIFPLNELPFVQSSMTLPQITCQRLPLSLKVDIPPHGTMKLPLPIRYTIGNKTRLPQDLEIVIESSEGFMFSGHKQMTLKLLPLDSQELVYNLFPLIAGNVTLPRLHVNMARFPGSGITETIHKLIPSQIFILPSAKGFNEDENMTIPITATS